MKTPRARMPNYANGKIYCIRNRADGNKIVYIGSTTRRLSERMAQHRKDMRADHCQGMKLYKLMQVVGPDSFYIELVADFACQRREQLLQEEGRHIRLNDSINNGCNSFMAGRTQKESYQAYFEANRAQINAHNRAHYEANRVTILAKRAQKKADRLAAVQNPAPIVEDQAAA